MSKSNAVVDLSGVQGSAEVSRVLVWGNQIPALDTIWTEIAA